MANCEIVLSDAKTGSQLLKTCIILHIFDEDLFSDKILNKNIDQNLKILEKIFYYCFCVVKFLSNLCFMRHQEILR